MLYQQKTDCIDSFYATLCQQPDIFTLNNQIGCQTKKHQVTEGFSFKCSSTWWKNLCFYSNSRRLLQTAALISLHQYIVVIREGFITRILQGLEIFCLRRQNCSPARGLGDLDKMPAIISHVWERVRMCACVCMCMRESIISKRS